MSLKPSNVLQGHFAVFRSRLNGDVDARFTQDTLHMERETDATDARFKNNI